MNFQVLIIRSMSFLHFFLSTEPGDLVVRARDGALLDFILHVYDSYWVVHGTACNCTTSENDREKLLIARS